jgi:GWxTD domain-containing protein
MKVLRIFDMVILVILICVCYTSAQDDNNLTPIAKKYFFLDPLVFYGKDSVKARLDLYIEIPLVNLQFKKNQVENSFEASVDYTVIIINSKKDVVINKTYTELIKNTPEELKGVNDASDFIIKQFFFSPDTYVLNFAFRDRNSFEESSKEINFEIKDFKSKDILFSDIMIVSDYKEDEKNKKIITPLVDNNIGNLKEFYLFFEVYNFNELPTPGEYKYKVTGEQSKVIVEGNLSYVLQLGENKKIEKIPTDNFSMGSYRLEITNAKNSEVVAAKDFIFRWGELPVTVKDLNVAIDQLVYIATEDELDFIKAGKTNAEREKRFIKFWKDKDPTPKTPRNEILLEYFNRIKIANERFRTTYRAGWKSDMGMVYIIYGEPSSMDKHPYGDVETGYDKPYEIWDYYDINKQFVFIDDTEFGDYRLLTPIWDKQATRMRF